MEYANKFELKSEFKPTGDQPEAIEKLVEGINNGMKKQTLMGVTGSGKTFTMANVIERVNRPTLVLEPNKTLAAQICSDLGRVFRFVLRLLPTGSLYPVYRRLY